MEAGASGSGPYAVSSDVIAAEVDGEAVLLHLGSRRYFLLNETASAVWHGVSEGRDEGALLDDLCSRFEVERETAAEALAALLLELEARQLISGR